VCDGRYSVVTGKGSGCQNRRRGRNRFLADSQVSKTICVRKEFLQPAPHAGMLENFVPPYESTVTHPGRLAVMVGKTTEFAMGSSTENSAYQVTANPWDRECRGFFECSAAAVASGECAVATLPDTGGSDPSTCLFCGGGNETNWRFVWFSCVCFIF